MTRLLATAFLMAHGGVHAAIWMAPRTADAPFDAAHSWLFGDVRRPALVLALAAAVAFLAAGVGYFTGQEWWGVAGAVGAVTSIVLLAITFTPWWLAALAINAVIVVVAWPHVSEVLR